MGHNVQRNEHSIDGKVIYISPPKYISEKFSKQILAMEVFDGERRNEVSFSFSNARMESLKDIKVGDWVNIQFRLNGNRAKGDGEPKWYNDNNALTCIKG
jgi:hypothetical protein